MSIMVLDKGEETRLAPLISQWRDLAAPNGDRYGVDLSVDIALRTFGEMITSPNSDVLVATDEAGEIVGCMGIYLAPYHMGANIMAHECCFFVNPAHRSAGIRLVNAAEQWTRAHGASHLILTASRLAGDSDRAGRFFEVVGFDRFETSYVKAVRP